MDTGPAREVAPYTLWPATPADAAVLTWLGCVATPDVDAPPPAAPNRERVGRCQPPPDLERRRIVMVEGRAAGVVAADPRVSGHVLVILLRGGATYKASSDRLGHGGRRLYPARLSPRGALPRTCISTAPGAGAGGRCRGLSCSPA